MLGAAPTLLRPPYGLFNRATQQAARACGLKAVIEWTATMCAGQLKVAGGTLRPGDIILLHFRPTHYDDLVRLLAMLQADHFSVAKLESYLVPA